VKQIEGKARRHQRFDRMFFWYVPLMSLVMAGILLNASGWQWHLMAFSIPGFGLGYVLCALLTQVRE